MKTLLDFIPLIIFFYLYKTTDPQNTNHPLLQLTGAGVNNNHILVATIGLVVSMLLVYGFIFVKQKFRLEKQQWFILLMTVVFGGLTLALSDDYYIRLKAVLINIAFALGVLISPLFIKDKEPFAKKMFGQILELSPKAWQKFNIAWAGLFLLMASLHGFFAFVFMNGKYWGEFTAFGDILVMVAFMAIMLFVLRKHFKTGE